MIYPSKRAQLEQRRIELVLRDDEQDGAPRRAGIDLDAGVARLERHGPARSPSEEGGRWEVPEEARQGAGSCQRSV
ncbi:DUF6191 domain-containing protein [Streptomyces abikoensis]|uniref:DUF6191 domain-containing protein n=1 Tax=Streptomyces abikoensis TaxID=97398 RepID=UPI0037208397